MTAKLNIENNKFVENKIIEFSYLFSILNKKLLLNESHIKNKLKLLRVLDKLVNVLILVCDNKTNGYIKNCVINENSNFLANHLTLLIKKYSDKNRTNRTRNRGQTSYSTRKLWKQKGTGKARAGSRNSPVFRGGGIVFGPSGISNKIKINEKLKKKLFFTSLALKIKSLLILDLLNDCEIKTLSNDKKVLILVDTVDYKDYKAIYLKYSNYKNITIKSIGLVNSFDILKSNFILISVASLFKLFRRLI